MWFVFLENVKHPNLISQELVTRRTESASQARLLHNPQAGLGEQIARYKRQKSELLNLFLNRDSSLAGLTQEEYQTKSKQLSDQIASLENQVTDLRASLKTDSLSKDREQASVEILDAIRIAAEHATFADTRALLRFQDTHVYDGEKIQMRAGYQRTLLCGTNCKL